MSEELAELRSAIKKEADTLEHDEAVVEIGKAEVAAKESNGPKALEHLKKAGKWVLKKAEELGMELAKEAMKASMGL